MGSERDESRAAGVIAEGGAVGDGESVVVVAAAAVAATEADAYVAAAAAAEAGAHAAAAAEAGAHAAAAAAAGCDCGSRGSPAASDAGDADGAGDGRATRQNQHQIDADQFHQCPSGDEASRRQIGSQDDPKRATKRGGKKTLI